MNVVLDWVLSDGKGAVAYLPQYYVKGSTLKTPFGPGVVEARREDGGVNVVLNWVLSDGKGAVAYIPNPEELKILNNEDAHRASSSAVNLASCRSCVLL